MRSSAQSVIRAIPGLIQALIAGPQRLRSRVADILGEMGWEPWSDAERACYRSHGRSGRRSP